MRAGEPESLEQGEPREPGELCEPGDVNQGSVNKEIFFKRVSKHVHVFIFSSTFVKKTLTQ